MIEILALATLVEWDRTKCLLNVLTTAYEESMLTHREKHYSVDRDRSWLTFPIPEIACRASSSIAHPCQLDMEQL